MTFLMNEQGYYISAGLSVTHYFIYNGKRFPFNMGLFNCFSQYFISKQIISTDINLVEDSDDIILSDLIKSWWYYFINYCQNKSIFLHQGNSLSLNKLSKKYFVLSLIKQTETFINAGQSNKKDLIYQITKGLNDIKQLQIELKNSVKLQFDQFQSQIEDGIKIIRSHIYKSHPIQIKESNTGSSSQKDSISFKFLNSFDQKWILDFLKASISITCGETNQPISFIKNESNSFFINASSINNAFIKFDFI